MSHKAIEERNRAVRLNIEMQPDFVDEEGRAIRIGDAVRYANNRDDVWNTDRWGIVTGLARMQALSGGYNTSVRVSNVTVTDGDHLGPWNNGEWFAAPTSLRLIG